MSPQAIGSALVLAGLVLVGVGLLIWLGGSGWLRWFGHLPGDIRIEKESVRVYVPIVSMLLVSVVLSVLWALLRRLL